MQPTVPDPLHPLSGITLPDISNPRWRATPLATRVCRSIDVPEITTVILFLNGPNNKETSKKTPNGGGGFTSCACSPRISEQ